MDAWTPISPFPHGRPYVLLNAAMSIDGKICTWGGDSHFSDEEDWRQVHGIRASVDAIMVGVNTILKDNPSLQVKYHPVVKPPIRVIVDSEKHPPWTQDPKLAGRVREIQRLRNVLRPLLP